MKSRWKVMTIIKNKVYMCVCFVKEQSIVCDGMILSLSRLSLLQSVAQKIDCNKRQDAHFFLSKAKFATRKKKISHPSVIKTPLHTWEWARLQPGRENKETEGERERIWMNVCCLVQGQNGRIRSSHIIASVFWWFVAMSFEDCHSSSKMLLLLEGQSWPANEDLTKISSAVLRAFLPSKYSQTCKLRPPKGLGRSGPISQVVSFARLGFKFFNMELYTCPCASHCHQRLVVPTCTWGRNWQRPCQEDLANAMIARPECLRGKSWTIEKVFFAQFDVCGRFSQVESKFWADLRCPQFAFLRWSHFQERTPSICELKGLKLRVRNFQVVSFLRWSQGQVRL